MSFDENISMLSMAFYKVIMICGPLLGLALAIGLLIGIFQAATSIQEMTNFVQSCSSFQSFASW